VSSVDGNSLEQPAVAPIQSSSQADPIIRFEHVTVAFDDEPALIDVSFELYAGETTVIMGAASSGKTVLLKTAIGLIHPDAGRVYLFGQNITNLAERQLFAFRRRAGVLFQEGGVFDSLTVEENVAYPLVNPSDRKLPESEVEARVKEALGFVDLVDTIDKYPSDLSGGMRRRVGIARAAVTRPPLMLYDSPTAGLDPITAYDIMALVIRQRDTRNTTSMVVTYRYQDGLLLANYKYDAASGKIIRARLDRRIHFLILRQGKLVFEGSEEELRSSSDPYVAKFVRRMVATPGQEVQHREPLEASDGKDVLAKLLSFGKNTSVNNRS
jgi:phospholipid/cholesterol/gamma-HCH transport system ATP-binding protein